MHSSIGGWLLLGLGVIHATVGFLVILKDWGKVVPGMTRYARLPGLKFLPLGLAISSLVGFSVWIILALEDGHPKVAIILIILGVLQVLAVLLKRSYRPLKLPGSENLLEGGAER